jgi:DNA-binding transcriptional regulator GbsR (MarR family)
MQNLSLESLNESRSKWSREITKALEDYKSAKTESTENRKEESLKEVIT